MMIVAALKPRFGSYRLSVIVSLHGGILRRPKLSYAFEADLIFPVGSGTVQRRGE